MVFLCLFGQIIHGNDHFMQDYERGDGTLRNPVLSSGGLIDLVIVIG